MNTKVANIMTSWKGVQLSGGTSGQALQKKSDSDFDVQWNDILPRGGAKD